MTIAISNTIEVDATGFVRFQSHEWPCALGRNGVGLKQQEGDGLTPTGTFSLGRVFWRADRLTRPRTGLSTLEISPNMGWCDDPTHADYNQLITVPHGTHHGTHHENLWREDHLYDVVVVILYNINPVIPLLGSAIFMHIAKPQQTPTEGCIALNKNDLLALLQNCNENTKLHIPLS